MKNKDGNVPVDYFDVVMFGKQAESLKPYLVKGKQVAIDGHLQQERWQGKDGKNASKVSIVADTVQLIGGVQAKQGQTQENYQGDFQEDIPF
jgi:single-strand DNA-binding protein